jgi:primosomal protein N' (replication factor Y)
MTILRVALDVPLPRTFDYRVERATPADVGRRVVVPFGPRKLAGIVVEVCESSEVPPERLRAAHALLDDLAPLARDWLALARFTAEYYQRPLGEVIHAALPPRLRRPEPLRLGPTAYAITQAGRAAIATLPSRSLARRAALELAAAGTVPADSITAAVARDLLARGWMEPCPAPPRTPAFIAPHALTSAQAAAVEAIRAALGTYRACLLLGITGSGKTEVYLHVAAAALARGQQALVLVPEINLTPRLAEEFAARFPGARIVTLTSAVPDTERARAWLAVQRGEADIVLGTRLAVFAPLPAPGIVIVDEEHDASFKQQDGVRYSARDLAVFRAHAAGVPVVLGSATPSLETYQHALTGRYTLLELPRRAREGAALPAMRLVDLRTDPADDGVCASLAAAVRARLERGEQSLLFLNRRGYAPVLVCGACAWTAGCPRCSAHLVVHLGERALRCHHCGHAQPVPRACPTCGNVDLVPFGRGTQRLEASVAARFPDARVMRIDSDSTRNRGTWEAMAASIRAGEAQILIGTQILAKGHDFPNLTLVGVLNADAALVAPDYRAPERLFAQLMQVSGRAGRADAPGEVLIQTRYPEHPLYQALVRHDFRGFAQRLLEEREQAGFPPYVYEASLRAEARQMADAIAFLQRACAGAPPLDAAVTMFDPVPLTLARHNAWERAQVLLQAGSRRALQTFLREWSDMLYGAKPGAVRWHLDVDPLEF